MYVQSCALFTRGGVYRGVKEAMGGTLAQLSVSALMFDDILTGPISGVSAGQYIVGCTMDWDIGIEPSSADNGRWAIRAVCQLTWNTTIRNARVRDPMMTKLAQAHDHMQACKLANIITYIQYYLH